MMLLDVETRRLIIEIGLAAVNNGLYPQAEVIRYALPYLTDNLQARNILDAVMLIGLGDPYGANELLSTDNSAEADMVRQLIQQMVPAAT